MNSSRTSLDKQTHHRANTTMHVCWHRNTSVSMSDHSLAVEVLLPCPQLHANTAVYIHQHAHDTHQQHVHQTSHLHTCISGVSGNGFAFCFLLNLLTPFKCSFFPLCFHFQFFKALTVNFSLIDHLLFFMCMQEHSSDTGFSPHRPEGFPNMLFFPLLRANMLTLFSAPCCSFFSSSLSSSSSSLRFSGCLTRTSSSLSPRSGPKTKYHHTCLLVPKPEPLSH